MEEKKIPDFIKNRLDVKCQSVYAFDAAVEMLKLPKDHILLSPETKVIIVTNFGTVVGEMVGPQEKGETISQMVINSFISSRNNIWADNESDKNVINNSSIVIVKNAKVTPFANPICSTNFEILCLFSDQIVGFSFGAAE